MMPEGVNIDSHSVRSECSTATCNPNRLTCIEGVHLTSSCIPWESKPMIDSQALRFELRNADNNADVSIWKGSVCYHQSSTLQHTFAVGLFNCVTSVPTMVRYCGLEPERCALQRWTRASADQKHSRDASQSRGGTRKTVNVGWHESLQ